MKVLVVAALLAGCVDTNSVTCDDGRVCPQFTVCEDRIHACLLDDQVSTCRKATTKPNDACSTNAGAGFCRDIDGDGDCADCLCLPPTCGDGFVDGAEQCDGASLGARPDCTDHAFYDSAPVACNADCTYDVSACTRTCGDGVLDTDRGEICDGAPPTRTCIGFGYDAGSLACLPSGCSPDFATCTTFDWTPIERDAAHLATMTEAGGHVFAAGVAVDGTGVLLDFDGIRWATHAAPYRYDFSASWAAAADDVWLVGADVDTDARHLVHWTGGATWTDRAITAAGAIWGSTANDIWLFANGTPMHYDGTTWSPAPIPDLQQTLFAWGTGAHDIWISGYTIASPHNALFHYDGTWSEVAAFASLYPGAGWSFAPDDVYLSCLSGIEHWNGTTWTVIQGGFGGFALWGPAPNDLYVASSTGVRHFDGARWSAISATVVPHALGGTSAIAMGVAPLDPVVYRYGGAAWIADTHLLGKPRIDKLWSPRADEIFAVFAGQYGGDLAHFADGGTATIVATSSKALGIGGAGADTYAIGRAGYVARWNGTTFVPETLPTTVEGMTSPLFVAVAGPSATRVFGVGTGIVTRTGATIWYACSVDPILSAAPLADVWCDPAGAACVAVGVGGRVYRWNGVADGCAWTAQATPTQSNLTSVWGASPTDVWAVGLNGVVLHSDGATWTPAPIADVGDALSSIRGTSATDVFVTTVGGLVYHYDGADWAEVRTPGAIDTPRLAPTPTTTWLAGGNPTDFTAILERLERTHW